MTSRKEPLVAKGIKITVEDLETGECDSRVIDNDYMLVTAGNRYLSSVSANPVTGTATLVVKREGTDRD